MLYLHNAHGWNQQGQLLLELADKSSLLLVSFSSIPTGLKDTFFFHQSDNNHWLHLSQHQRCRINNPLWSALAPQPDHLPLQVELQLPTQRQTPQNESGRILCSKILSEELLLYSDTVDTIVCPLIGKVYPSIDEIDWGIITVPTQLKNIAEQYFQSTSPPVKTLSQWQTSTITVQTAETCLKSVDQCQLPKNWAVVWNKEIHKARVQRYISKCCAQSIRKNTNRETKRSKIAIPRDSWSQQPTSIKETSEW